MNYFLDTSSLVKIYHRESGTDLVLDIYRGDGKIGISELSKVEFVTTIQRKYREKILDHKVGQIILDKFLNDIDQI